jgi:hypothetical protein
MNASVKTKDPFVMDDYPVLTGPYNAIQIVRVKSGCSFCESFCVGTAWGRGGQEMDMKYNGATGEACWNKDNEHDLPIKFERGMKDTAHVAFFTLASTQISNVSIGANTGAIVLPR